MRFVGIDVAAERHVVATVDESGAVLLKPTAFTEDAQGYQKLLSLLGPAPDTVVALEATGHYWKNLFAAMVAAGFAVGLLNPLRPRRFAGEKLQRTQTGAIDALGSRASPPRSARRPAACWIGRPRSCGSWCGSAIAWSRTSATAFASSTGSSTSASPGSPAASRTWPASWPPCSCVTIPPQPPSRGLAPPPGRAPVRPPQDR